LSLVDPVSASECLVRLLSTLLGWSDASGRDIRQDRKGHQRPQRPVPLSVTSKLAALCALLAFPAHASCQGGTSDL